MNQCRVMMIISAIACLAIMNAPAGAEWVPQPPGILPVNHMTRALHAVDTNIIWAVSDTTDPSFFTYTPRVARSTDAGTTWNVSTIPGTAGYILIDVFALDASTAWVAAFDVTQTAGGIYKTTDGGTLWVRQLTGPWIWVAFFDALNGVAVSIWTTPRARTTTDGGATWQPAPVQPPLNGALLHAGNNSRAVVGNTIWVVGFPGRIYRSTDRGYNWTQHLVALPVNKVLSIAFRDASNGLLATWESGQSHTARTTDAGETWTALVAPSQPRAYCVTDVPQTSGGYVMVAGEEDAPFVGDYGGSTYTLDSGGTWIPVDNVFHSGVDFVDPTTGWAGGSSTQTTSGLYKWEGSALGIDTQAPAPRPQLYMSQNYPNPFSATTSIRFDLPNAGPVRLAVYDVFGREVETLVDGVQTAGAHVIVFDATRLTSGVYFYRLEGERTTEARNMLVTR